MEEHIKQNPRSIDIVVDINGFIVLVLFYCMLIILLSNLQSPLSYLQTMSCFTFDVLISVTYQSVLRGPRWQSGNTLASHL